MKLFFICLAIGLPATLLAQSNYHDGFVLKNNGDTLKGYVNYREWNESPRSIDFKINKEDKQALHFGPGTIKEFQINGMDTYVSYIGVISMNRINFNDLPASLDTTKKLDTLFLKQVVSGKHLTLYYQNDEIKTRFFIAETNGAPVELKYYVYINDVKRVLNTDVYKGQLLLYINKYIPGNNKLVSQVEEMNYAQPDLESVIDKINNNGNAVKRKAPARFFAGLGINSTITEVYAVDYSNVTQHSTTVSPTLSAGVDIFDNPNVQRLIFRIGVYFSYVTPREKYPVTVGGINTYQLYEFNQYTGSITPQIILNVYNKDNFKFFIGAGVAFNFSTYSNDKLTLISSNQNDVNANTIQQPYRLEPSWSNFPLQAGVTLNKKVELCFTYIGYTAYTKYEGFYASNQTMSLGVKYLFGK